MARSVAETERLRLVESDRRLAQAVTAFLRDNRHFHTPWEPIRDETYFLEVNQRNYLTAQHREAKHGASRHLWLLPGAGLAGAPGGGGGGAPGSRPAGGPCDSPAARVIGAVSITNIVRGAFQSCYLGYRMDARYTRRGLMVEALIATLDLAFGPMALHRVEANVMPRNAASLAVVRKLGFHEEGLSRNYLKIHGNWEDHLRFALLADGWRGMPS